MPQLSVYNIMQRAEPRGHSDRVAQAYVCSFLSFRRRSSFPGLFVVHVF